ncbi:YbjQ family protein [Streptomyces sp. P17]|uniref:YbjQ family protein n=1 Tax=Streptomyces sp. P17 TaxID=3074716 RepID=UPI0028F41720|nr:YbjQ family protein [Streptomyces sp. P17]
MARCAECEKRVWALDLRQGLCPECYNKGVAAQPDATRKLERGAADTQGASAAIVLTTEQTIDRVVERLGIIAAERVYGLNILKDIATGLRDTFGGASGAMEKALREARRDVLDDLRRQAAEMKADAVIALRIEHAEMSGGALGGSKSMLMVVASGTAVRVRPETENTQISP